MNRVKELERLLNSIVIDVEAMQRAEPDWFGPFTVDQSCIEWPNLRILIGRAKQLLKGGKNDNKGGAGRRNAA